MRVVIVGGTVSGMKAALEYADKGWETVLIEQNSYLGDDIIATGAMNMREEHACCLYEGLVGCTAKDASPVQLKRSLLVLMKDAGVHIIYQARPAGITVEKGNISGVIITSRNGMRRIPCDKAIDATGLKDLQCAVSGKKTIITAGTPVVLRVCLINDKGEADHVMFRDVADPARGYMMTEVKTGYDMGIGQLRSWRLQKMEEWLRTIGREQTYKTFRLDSMPSVLEFEMNSTGAEEVAFDGNGDGANYALIGGKKFDFVEEDGAFCIALQMTPSEICDVCVAGAGTAGTWASLAAARSGADVILTESLPLPGGTRTMAGVSFFYCGNRNGLFQKMWNELSDFSGQIWPSSPKVNPVTEVLFYDRAFRDTGIKYMPCASLFNVKTNHGKIAEMHVSAEDGLHVISAKQYIDATGDALSAELAGCPTVTGDDDRHRTQNYSQWNICAPERSAYRAVDQDTADLTCDDEWTRALENNLMMAEEHDLFELIGIRESRRIKGKYYLTKEDVFRGKRTNDVLIDAYSTYDPHARCFSDIGRLGVLPLLGRPHFVGVPLASLLTKDISNLVVLGKALSADQIAFNFLRMCPDIMTLGWIAGVLCNESIRSNTDIGNLDLKPIQDTLVKEGALVEPVPQTETFKLTADAVIARILAGNEDALADGLLCGFPDMAEKMRDRGRSASNQLLYKKAMLAFGDSTYADDLTEELVQIDKKYEDMIYSDRQSYKGVIKGGIIGKADEYWLMNQLAVMLSKVKHQKAIPVIAQMLSNTSTSGEWLDEDSIHARIRLENNTIPNYDRIWCLARAAVYQPSESYIPELERIYNEIAKQDMQVASFYKDDLLISIREALYACGVKKEDLPTAGIDTGYAVNLRALNELK